jgi:hypothetical protein
MLEVLLVYLLGKRIAGIVRAKGRSPGGYVAGFVGLWIGGEILGAIIGVLVTDGEAGAGAYLFALVGAATGAVLGFVIANSASPLQQGVYHTGGFPVVQNPGVPNYGGYANPPQAPHGYPAAPAPPPSNWPPRG